ncbi:DUF580-domain-containing protein [Microthyrium microscopicum]|uniref:Protein PNS1 n=1 Tax=Microthyrium microscopicum TaxID=703497 RepID=A0A6A6ULC6_9PEZI|nr:DUF580-domain-containing protein [Microthyrium microscopicum]
MKYQPPPPTNYQQPPPNNYQQQDYNNSGQQYNAPSQPPPQYGYSAPNYDPNGEKQHFDQTFQVKKPKMNDLWAGILFLVVCAGFIAVSVIAFRGYNTNKNSKNSYAVNAKSGYLIILVILAAFVLSWGYIFLARLYPKVFIWVSGILNIVLGIATAILLLVRKQYAGGIIAALFAAFTVFAFITWIPRIPFSAFMLTTSINVSKKYGHVYLVSLIGGFLAAAFAAWFAASVAAISVHWGNSSSGTVAGLIFFMTFAAFWISEWLKATMQATISGVYGSWYFCSNNFPKGATRGAFKRTITYSFGSISLGSLITAIVNLLRQLCSIAQNNEAGQGNAAAAMALCVLGCLLSILDWVVNFVNRYAFITIALYGKSYFEAAKATWSLIKDRGFDALINLCLLGPVFSMGSVAVGFVCAILAFAYQEFIMDGFGTNGWSFAIVAFAFLIGSQICSIMVTPISTGVDTIFVAAAWDPEVLQRDHPDLYAQFLSVYPPLAHAINA